MKFRKWMAAFILGGAFLIGTGAGISFAEYSTLEYQGNVLLGEENTAEKKLVCRMSETPDRILALLYPADPDCTEVEEDKKVPKDELWMEVTYNQKYGEPNVSPEADESDVYYEEEMDRPGAGRKTAEKNAFVTLWFDRNGMENEVQMLIQARDRFLKELKEGKFSTYETREVYSVKVLVNPENADILEIEW